MVFYSETRFLLIQQYMYYLPYFTRVDFKKSENLLSVQFMNIPPRKFNRTENYLNLIYLLA
jgi:hypothetical protein